MVYSLMDGVHLNNEHPGTFQIPSPSEKADLKAGDWVKLGFEQEGKRTERMWVRITSRVNDNFEGTLDNDPNNLTAIKHGDVVRFNSKHIIGVE